MNKESIAKLSRAITLLETSEYQGDIDDAVALLKEVLEEALNQ